VIYKQNCEYFPEFDITDEFHKIEHSFRSRAQLSKVRICCAVLMARELYARVSRSEVRPTFLQLLTAWRNNLLFLRSRMQTFL
jgi:hypothetical protein